MDFSVWPINVIYPPRNKVLSSQGVKENLEPIDYLFRRVSKEFQNLLLSGTETKRQAAKLLFTFWLMKSWHVLTFFNPVCRQKCTKMQMIFIDFESRAEQTKGFHKFGIGLQRISKLISSNFSIFLCKTITVLVFQYFVRNP